MFRTSEVNMGKFVIHNKYCEWLTMSCLRPVKDCSTELAVRTWRFIAACSPRSRIIRSFTASPCSKTHTRTNTHKTFMHFCFLMQIKRAVIQSVSWGQHFAYWLIDITAKNPARPTQQLLCYKPKIFSVLCHIFKNIISADISLNIVILF